jgi:ABC-type transport system involved in cytochrome c biogenesis permease subunit
VERLPYIAVILAWAFVSIGHLVPDMLGETLRKWIRAVAIGAVVVHAVTLVVAAFVTEWTGFPEALSATSLGVGIAYTLVDRKNLRAIGLLLAPLAMVALGTSLVVPHRTVVALEHTGVSPWLPIHLGLMFAGIAGFALSSVVGVVYLWARARLKNKKFHGMSRVPSLEVLDRIQFRAMLFGFLFLTLGIGAGGVWAAASLQETWEIDPKVWFTLLIWAWYGAALQVRLVAGRRGRWTALFSIVGFGGLVFSLVGLNFLLGGWHAYGG